MPSPEKLTTDAAFTAARQSFGAGFRPNSAAPPPPPSVNRNPAYRIIQVVLFAALSILAVSAIIYEAPAAFADHTGDKEIWSATLTVPVIGGCINAVPGSECSSASVLTDDDVRHVGVDYAVVSIIPVTNSGFGFYLDKAIPVAIRSAGTLYVDGSPFRLADATFTNGNKGAEWTNHGLSWSAGDTVQLRLTEPSQALHASISGNPVEGGEAVTLTLTLSLPVERETSIQRVLGGTASHDRTPDADYRYVKLPTFAAGSTTTTAQIKAVDDDLVEGCETMTWRMTMWPGTDRAVHLFYTVYIEDNDGGDSCPTDDAPPAPPTPTPTPTPGTSTPTTSASGGGTSTPTTSSSGGAFFFVPSTGDTTSPTIISMNTTGNATRTLGDGAPLLFNITFSERVTGVDPADFVLAYGNDTLTVSANATSINATTNPEQVVPQDDAAEFVIEMEPGGIVHDGATVSNGTVRFDIEHLGSHLLEVRLTAPDCRTLLVHNQTFQFRPDLAKPRTIEPLAGSPVAGPWTLAVRNLAMYHNATVHMYGLTLDVGPAITVNGTGSNYLVAVNAAASGNLTLGLADGHDIADASGNRLAGGIPAGANNTYVLAEPPRRTCP